MTLQRSMGNRAVQRLLANGKISDAPQTQPGSMLVQRKLQVGPANDQYEREADQVASTIMRQVQSPSTQNHTSDESVEQPTLQRLTPVTPSHLHRQVAQTDAIGMDGGEVGTEMATQIQRSRGSGQPLEANTRAKMESSFGRDFSNVKIHTNGEADQLNRAMNAHAFTTGQDLFFRQGAYAPNNAAGQKLIAHELTHVVQQGHGGGARGGGVGNGGVVQRLVDTEIAQMEDIKQNARYFGNKDKKVLKALKKYNLYMRQGGAPTPKVKQNLQKVQDMVADMMFSTDKKKIKDPFHETRERTLQQIHLRLAKEIQDLGSYRDMSWARKLGSGQMNTVWETSFDDGLKGVFKQDEPIAADELDPSGLFFEGRSSGIDARDTNLGSRNIAMYKLDQLLGTGVIPRTERAVHGDRVGTVMEKVEGRQLHVSDKAKDLKTSLNIDYSNEVVQRGMSNLQLLDMICGQTDRHGANVMVTKDEQGNIVGVRGIDNDLSFGVDNDGEQFISQDMGLPSYIDWQVAQNILQITPSDIRETLTGLLTVAEINKTIERFETAKAYIEALVVFEQAFARGEQTGPAPRHGKLVRHWDQETYDEQLSNAKERVIEDYAQSRNRTLEEVREDLDGVLSFTSRRGTSGSYLFVQSYELERVTKMLQEQETEGVAIKDL